jgi:hypothetical protein
MRLPLRLSAPALCLFVLPLCGPAGQAADDSPRELPLDAEVASSAPVHEAFAAPRPTSLDAPALVEKAPPRPLREDIPDEKPEGDNVQWIPGYWDYDGDASKFVWVSGVWRMPPPGRQWAAGYWVEADGQWRRQPGFWAAFNAGEKNQQLVYFPKPPEPRGENVEDTPANKVFAPGSWTYGATGYTWNAGQYINAAPGWSWTTASYSWTPAGYTYTRGYWDYSYARRGLVYAPVYLPRAVRNVANYYYRPIRVYAPGYLASTLAVAGNSRAYYLRNAKITNVKNVTGIKLVALTPAQKTHYRAMAQRFNSTAIVRSRLEGKGSASLATGPVRHPINLPTPRTNSANSRLQPPPWPTAANVRTATPARTTVAPANAAKKPVVPAVHPKKELSKKAPHPKKEPPKKNNAKKAPPKQEHKKK